MVGHWHPIPTSVISPPTVFGRTKKPRPPLSFESDRTVDQLERSRAVRNGKRFVRMFSRQYHDLRILNPCTLPATGGAILVSNHTSSLDPVPLQTACPRLITSM